MRPNIFLLHYIKILNEKLNKVSMQSLYYIILHYIKILYRRVLQRKDDVY